MVADIRTGTLVTRVIVLGWLVAFAVYLGTCASYRPLGFEAGQASRFGFLFTSLVGLSIVVGVLAILHRTKPRPSAAVLYTLSAVVSATLLSFLMVMCYAP